MNPKVIIVALTTSLLVGCTMADFDDSVLFQNTDVAHIFTATLERSDTRVFYGGSHNHWTEKDQISIFCGNALNLIGTFNGENGASSGDFFVGPASLVVSSRPIIGATIGVYPYNMYTSIKDDGTVNLVLPAVQQYAKRSFGLGANTMVAITKDLNDDKLQFKNLCGYLVIKLYGKGVVTSLTIEGNNGEPLAGMAMVKPNHNSSPTFMMSEIATTSITIDCGSGVELGSTEKDATEFWFVVPPVTFSKGFTITVVGNGTTCMKKATTKEFTINRNVINTMRTIEAVFDIPIEKNVDFEDAKFKSLCVAKYDKNNDGEISYYEALSIERLSISGYSISSLRGLEAFVNLTSLSCGNNGLTHLDVSKNTQLTELKCYRNSELTELDLSHNPILAQLNCENCGLIRLDLSNNNGLMSLSCSGNALSSLDLSNNTQLTALGCSRNVLSALDVSGAQSLVYIACSENRLTCLDVSANLELTDLICRQNWLTSLDLSNNLHLTRLECSFNRGITSLDLRNNSLLKKLQSSYLSLMQLDVSYCTVLEEIECVGSGLKSIDLSNNRALITLWCTSNSLTTLDLSNNTALTTLDCDRNYLTTLDLSNNTALTTLGCMENQLTSLDVSNNMSLTTLDCTSNPLESIFLKNGQKIKNFRYPSTATLYYK